MELKDIIPKESKLKLKAFKDPLILKPITLRDEAWLAEEYGERGIIEVFENVNMLEISRIVFKLLRAEDKLKFKNREVTFILEDGSETTEDLGGVNLLMQCISGQKEKTAVFMALLENIGLSRPDIEEKEEPVKKKTRKKKVRK